MNMTITLEGVLSHIAASLDIVCECWYSVSYCSDTLRECWNIESAVILWEECRDSMECLILCQSAVTVFFSADNVCVCVCVCVCVYKIEPMCCALCESNVALSERFETVWVSGVNLYFRAVTQWRWENAVRDYSFPGRVFWPLVSVLIQCVNTLFPL